ncbi:response regulator [Massilia sp. IC2-477]|uniref:response regulator n=1 Tax=unclassified Massilia TaxID=2609279 RepID=UPI001D10C1AF|nr:MULTISPECIES: response regulator [unclassified Massilia]MCC2956362.1 response regulator [Massilia sp. IC2-477]MCC2972269.1 response regulator [Massilia sp. IC2-476]
MAINVLLVDDLMLDVALTRRAMEECSIAHRIVVAADGEEAQRLAGEAAFDLLLVDIKMPRVDGFELMQRLRERAGLPLPVIVLSGSSLFTDRARAEELGAIEYVHKALDFGEFRHALKAALGRHGFC